MAHEIHKHDNMFYFGSKPWHGLGVELDHAATAAEAIAAAKLNWTVSKRPLYFEDRNMIETVPNRVIMVRDDIGYPLGVVSNRYSIIQNVEAFALCDSIVGEKLAAYHTAGSLFNGCKIWMLLKLPDHIRVNGGDDLVEKFLLLSNSHDGSLSLRVSITPIRVVCNNTLNAAIDNVNNQWSITHKGNLEIKVSEIRDVIGLVNEFYAEFEALCNHMVSKKLSTDNIAEYFNRVFPMPVIEDGDSDARIEKVEQMRENVLDLTFAGVGSNMNHGTMWSLYNGTTEYIDHVSKYRRPDTKLDNIWFGQGATLKTEAFRAASELALN